MAINKAMRAVLGAITALDIDVKRTYRFERRMEIILAHLRGAPSDYQVWDRQVRNGAHTVPVRLFRPPGTGPCPLIVYFHGGGWVTGGIENYTGVCADLAVATGNQVALVDYRLAPEHRFPIAPEDCYAATRELFLGGMTDVAQEDITLMGDSAGGNLAAAVSLMARDRGEFLPRRQILVYPATGADHSDTSPFASIRENGSGYLLTSKRIRSVIELYQSSPADLQNPYFAPLVAEDLGRQPRTLLITAEFCPLRDEGEYYGKRLREAGNEVEILRIRDAIHAFLMLPPRFPHVKQTYRAIQTFLDRES